MLNTETKRHIDNARQVLVGKIPDPKSQIEQITNALIYKFMDDMDARAIAHGGYPTFFTENLEEYSWSKLMDRSLGAQDRMNRYDEALRKFGTAKQLPPLFRTIFKEALLPFKSPETLNLFLNEIAYFNYKNSEELGNAFEYLLSTLGTQGDAGQFRTPRHIIDFIVEVIDPKKTDTILDPACGTAGFLISAFKHIAESHDGVDENGKSNDEKRLTPAERKKIMENITGYDISPDMVRLSLVNMYLHGYQYGLQNPNIIEYDTLSQTDRWDEKFDVMLANPPFMTPKGGIVPHKKFEISANRAEVLFVDYIKTHLKPNGRAGIIVPEGIVFQSSNAYRELRKLLVEDGLYAVVSLPGGVFNPYSGVKTSILFFDNTVSKQTSKVLFIKIEDDGFELGSQRKESGKNDLPKAIEALKQFKINYTKEFKDSSFAWATDKSKILSSSDFSLSGERYQISTKLISKKWPMVELGEISEFIGGYAFKSEELKKVSKNKDDLPVVKIGNVDKSGILDISNAQYFEYKSFLKKYLISKDDILVAMTGATVGKVAYSQYDNLLLNQRVGLIKSNEKLVLKSFLKNLLLSDSFYNYCQSQAGGGAQGNISPNQIQKYKIPLLTIDAQKVIIEEIKNKQEIINSARDLIQKIEKEGENSGKLFEQLGINFVNLGNKDFFEIVSGGTPDSVNKDYWNGNINWITLVDLPQENLITKIYDSERKITKKGLTNSSAKLLPLETVVVSTRATIGRVAITKTELATNQGFKNIIIKDKKVFNPKFIAYFMTTLTQKMKTLASGGTFKEISKTSFETLEIPFLEIEKQNDIVDKFEKQIQAIDSNKNLIKIFEGQINDVINRIFEA
jgi:type I restriction enzyme M protein